MNHEATARRMSFSVIMALALGVLALLTFTGSAQAQGTDSKTSDSILRLTYTDSTQAEHSVYYSDYQEAFSAMNGLGTDNNNVKLTLVKDFTVRVGTDWANAIEVTRDSTLDLAGHTYTLISSAYSVSSIRVYGNITFTLEDSSSAGSGRIVAKAEGSGNDAQGIVVSATADRFGHDESSPHFVMEGGMVDTSDYALDISGSSQATIKGGTLLGCVSNHGTLTMKAGAIKAAVPTSVVFDMPGSSFYMSGGTISNTDEKSPIVDDNAKEAVCIEGEGATADISGGTIESLRGPALKIEDYSIAHTSTIQISGDAKLVSKSDATVRTDIGHSNHLQEPSKYIVTIEGNPTFDGDGTIFDFYKSPDVNEYTDRVTVNINGGWFNYGNGVICQPNSSMLAYPEGKVLDTKAAASGEHKGYYTLADKANLNQKVGNIDVGYQYLDGLTRSINSAKELYDQGNAAGRYDSGLWKKFADAYEEAQMVTSDANANQNEIDYFATRLTAAQRKMIDRANSGIDVSKLSGGVYSVQASMLYYPDADRLSMSNDAIEHTATLVVRNGVGTIYLDFKPTYVSGMYGSLMGLWSYPASSPAQALKNSENAGKDRKQALASGIQKEATYLSYQTVDLETGTVTPISDIPSEAPSASNSVRPKRVGIALPYIGTANDLNKIYVRVSVDVMAIIGVGDQNAVLNIDYSTLAKKDTSASDKAAADAVSAQIAKLPAASSLKRSDAAAVSKARAAWRALTDDQKVLVDDSALTAAEARITKLPAEAKVVRAVPSVKLSKTAYTWNGKAKKPAITVKVKGKRTSPSHYTVSWSKGRKAVGTYKATVTLKNGYAGKGSASFRIVPKGTSLKSVKKTGKRAVKVSWRKQAKQTTGYQVRLSTSKGFKKGVRTVTAKGTKRTSTTVKKLKSGKRCYVQVRTYKTVHGKRYASGWSAARSVKVA